MRWIAALLLLVSGCASPGTHYTVHVDPSLADHIDGVRTSIAKWTDAIPDLKVDVSVWWCTQAPSDDGICITKGDVGGHLGRTAYTPSCDCAVTWIDTANIDSASTPDEDLYVNTIAHEFGHAMSLAHTGPGSMMYGTDGTDRAATVTRTDLVQFWSTR